MKTEKHTPGAIRAAQILASADFVDNYAEIIDRETAALDLLEAAKLAVLHFKRDNISGNFQGDDAHEAWNALEAAIQKAEGAVKPPSGL